MIHKLSILSALILSTTCTVIHQVPINRSAIPYDNPNYSFSYNVNNQHTGDIKNQQETRHGGTVTGQYSLLQPDGVRRTVDYRADDLRGFLATVTNDRNLDRQDDVNDNATPLWPQVPQQIQVNQDLPPTYASPNLAPTYARQEPVAVSRSSIVQTINNNRVVQPWN